MKATETVIHDLEKERCDLNVKLGKLSRFKSSMYWFSIGATQRSLLDRQFNIMCTYRNILTTRIKDLKGETK